MGQCKNKTSKSENFLSTFHKYSVWLLHSFLNNFYFEILIFRFVVATHLLYLIVLGHYLDWCSTSVILKSRWTLWWTWCPSWRWRTSPRRMCPVSTPAWLVFIYISLANATLASWKGREVEKPRTLKIK